MKMKKINLRMITSRCNDEKMKVFFLPELPFFVKGFHIAGNLSASEKMKKEISVDTYQHRSFSFETSSNSRFIGFAFSGNSAIKPPI